MKKMRQKIAILLFALCATATVNAQTGAVSAPKFNRATCVDDIVGWYYWTSKTTTSLPEDGLAASVPAENITTKNSRIAITKVDESTVKIYGMFEMPVTGTINFSNPNNKYIDIPVNQAVGYSKTNGNILLKQNTWATDKWVSYTTVRWYFRTDVDRIYIYNNWAYTEEPNVEGKTYYLPGVNNNYLIAAQNSGNIKYAEWNAVMYTTYGKKNRHNWSYETRCVNVTQNGNKLTVDNFLGNSVSVDIDLHADNTISITKGQNAASGGSLLYPATINDESGEASADTENDIIGEGAQNKVNWGNFCRSYSNGYYYFSDSEIVMLSGDLYPIRFPVALTMTDAGWASFSSDKALDFSTVTALKPYFVTAVDESNGATLSDVVDPVAPHTGLFIEGAAGDYEIPTVIEGSMPPANELVATSEGEHTSDGQTYWGLGLDANSGQIGLKKMSAGTVAANKAYLIFNRTAAGAKSFLPFNFGGTTAIEGSLTPNPSPEGKGSLYNLQGQRVGEGYRGIVIKNGKKVVKH